MGQRDERSKRWWNYTKHPLWERETMMLKTSLQGPVYVVRPSAHLQSRLMEQKVGFPAG